MFDYKKLIALGIFLCYLETIASTEDVCVKKGPCSCEFSNGTGIDLSPTATGFAMTQTYELKNDGSQYSLSTYYYHPCYDIQLKINTTKVIGTCGNPLSICRYTRNFDLQNATKDTFKIDDGNYEFMGSSNITQFGADGKSIIYFNGPSSTVVMLICAQTDNRLHIYSLEEPDKIVLAFYSRDACLKQIEELGPSLGTTLLIILFSFVALYLALGICTKKFLMGATGIEVIPNLSFWSDLPNLVRDGWAFALNGFKLPSRSQGPVTSPDPNSYDSI
ncbi:unnamed protein product [Danaus chrysippus]|uniref:(African queen) hypothetical protein n=1 Tax=Danaus chrysippus TaxID=151541 RepID=A0A8J2VWL4_9NEOP|nr:unnamed protein product [Danaus chrysippus]